MAAMTPGCRFEVAAVLISELSLMAADGNGDGDGDPAAMKSDVGGGMMAAARNARDTPSEDASSGRAASAAFNAPEDAAATTLAFKRSAIVLVLAPLPSLEIASSAAILNTTS